MGRGRSPRRPTGAGAALGLLLGALPVAAGAQEAGPEPWNGPRAAALVERARDRRQEPLADSTLRNYRADATGHIYFFLDREEAGEPVLLRADQVALELYWAQNGRTRQVIRGMRSEEQFPIKNFAYYLDRYTVIQNGFGDEIRVGEGRDVADVPHPLAPGADSIYDFRLADSMTIRLPGRSEPLRVYEVQVRPRDFGVAAIVGSLFLERARGDLVRLAFTFTPSAYLDPRNERVEVALENALWEGRYWLPREQRLLVRREIPELDLDVGTVIRAVLRVTDYELNVDIPRAFFAGPPVILAEGPEGLASHDFSEGLYEGLADVGLAPGAEAGTLDAVDVDAIAGRVLRERFLRGVPRVRFYAPNASAVLRYDRGEGFVTGAGLAYGIGEHQLTVYAARAWGAGMPIFEIAARPLSSARAAWFAEAYYNRPVDLGLRPAAAGVLSSLAAATIGEDYRDLYFERGVALGRELGADRRGSLALVLAAERHRSAARVERTPPIDNNVTFRLVRPIDEGDQVTLALLGRSVATAGRRGAGDTRFALEAGWFQGDAAEDPRWFAATSFHALRSWRGADLRWGVDLRSSIRLTSGAPLQHGALLGGRNTLPGYEIRSLYGEQLVLADVEAWATAVPRWLRVRGLLGGAWAHAADHHEVPAYAGVGLGFIDGILRLDYALPIGSRYDLFLPDPADGVIPVPAAIRNGALILSIDPRLWPFL
ncbi:MAG: hypothetical protein KY466_04830 [Gemmatimonadetes bacterium]|nr:hypothetical protein [Gemmatimonadota bacterium]